MKAIVTAILILTASLAHAETVAPPQGVAPSSYVAPRFDPAGINTMPAVQERDLKRCRVAGRVCHVEPGIGVIMEPTK